MLYRATFMFNDNETPPAVGANDGWLGGSLVDVEFDPEPMVPLRLVEAIAKAWDETARCTDSCLISNVPAAIRAAREGAGK